MDYSIIRERLVCLSNGMAAVAAELIVASSEVIPYYNEVSGKTLEPGSVVIVPSESKLYILDTDFLWTEWGTGEKLPSPEDVPEDESEEE
ncbi:hypothetical protein SAMN02910317_02859 [Ruminococcaceae bacterium FB2012]|nr:hypothetical protein SAMN02910317_02859 [Ruminococcaceae bacterium FB2012]